MERYFELIPKEKGNYVLLFFLENEVQLPVGALDKSKFPTGQYTYVGSALGPGGIQSRVRHHLKPSPKPHWHIDYLKPYVHWVGVGWKVTEKRLECTWAQKLTAMKGADLPVFKFGASDCKQGCFAHLVRIPAKLPIVLKTLKIKDHIDFMYNKTNL